jgi:hypothetical protein
MATASDFATFKSTLAEWANRGDWSDDLLTQFVRDAEAKLNAELRIDRMINTVDATLYAACAPLPLDWLEMDLVRLPNQNTPSGYVVLHYKPRDEFFRTSVQPTPSWYPPYSAFGTYTIEGRQIFVGGPPDTVNGIDLRLDYYQEVPVFADTTPSWVYSKYPTLYRYAALTNADLHAVGEEQSAANMKQIAEDMIQKLNAQHRYARASGSRLGRTRIRSFG